MRYSTFRGKNWCRDSEMYWNGYSGSGWRVTRDSIKPKMFSWMSAKSRAINCIHRMSDTWDIPLFVAKISLVITVEIGKRLFWLWMKSYKKKFTTKNVLLNVSYFELNTITKPSLVILHPEQKIAFFIQFQSIFATKSGISQVSDILWTQLMALILADIQKNIFGKIFYLVTLHPESE